jgi:hypothetical protein
VSIPSEPCRWQQVEGIFSPKHLASIRSVEIQHVVDPDQQDWSLRIGRSTGERG